MKILEARFTGSEKSLSLLYGGAWKKIFSDWEDELKLGLIESDNIDNDKPELGFIIRIKSDGTNITDKDIEDWHREWNSFVSKAKRKIVLSPLGVKVETTIVEVNS